MRSKLQRLRSVAAALLLLACAAQVAIAATNHSPSISGTPSTTAQVGSTYSFTPTATDADGDTLAFYISNKPAWASFNTSNGTLSGAPPQSGSYSGISIGVTDGTAHTYLPVFTITVSTSSSPNNAPTISGTPSTNARTGSAYTFTPTASDADGDPLTFSVRNKPAWASFNSSTGTLGGTPTQTGTYANITISVSDGKTSRSLPSFTITVSSSSSNRSPSISGTPSKTAQVGSAYSFTPTATDPDGDTLSFYISNKPGWAGFSTTTGTLSGTPTQTGTYSNISIGVTDGKAHTYLPVFTIAVSTASSNNAPTISGTPSTTVQAGSAYAFTPSSSDADGDPLSFSVSNKPAWATFSTSTGALSGTPNAQQAGTYTNIVISVSDGKASRSLAAFAITVNTTSSNNPPVISGNPPTSVQAGSAYSFTPSASDADGDTLAFSITNKPAWAAFGTATGSLSGTPSTAQSGSYPNISIRVSDGKTSTALPTFGITVTQVGAGSVLLSWSAPPANIDGSPLNLGGYKIYHGTSASSLTDVRTSAGTATTFQFGSLSSGTHYFAVSAYSAAGAESDKSAVVSKAVP